jgi:CheY-like chemotaxis protein
MKPKILILEDDRWLAESLAASLKTQFSVRICYNPEAVFELLDQWWPDVLLADVLLGNKNWLTLAHELQSYHDTSCLNVVLLTTIADKIDIDDVRPLGVKKVLDKSTITPDALRQAIQQSVEEKP